MFLVDAAADPAGETPVGMDFATTHHLEQVVAVAAHLQHLAGDVQADFLDNAQDIPFRRRSGGADDEIRSGEGVEVGGVIGSEKDAIEQLTEFLSQRRRVDVKQGVERLGGGYVVRLGAHPADAIRQIGHILCRTPHAELLEPAQFGDLEVDVGNVTLVGEKDVDLPVAFQASDRVDRYALHD